MKDYSKLQNGSDIRGVAIVDRGQAAAGLPVQMPNLTPDDAADIATVTMIVGKRRQIVLQRRLRNKS